MKTPQYLVCLFLTSILFISSCAKKDATPRPSSTGTIVFDNGVTVQVDSVHWEYYSAGVPRVQAFKNNIAVVTLWPGTVASGTENLYTQYLYWIVTPPTIYTVNSTGGLLSLTNDSDVLTISLSASGNVYTGSGPSPSTITASFGYVRKVGS
jgi:hypothetical protein